MVDYGPFANIIRDRVSAQEVGRMFGLEFGRDGRCKCPFCGSRRKDTLRLYPGNRGYYCFSCHAGGDSFRLWREMTGDGFREAVKNMNDTFGLGLPIDGADPEAIRKAQEENRRRQEAAQEKAMRDRAVFEGYLDAIEAVQCCERVMAENAPKAPGEAFNDMYETAAKNIDQLREHRDRLAVLAIRKTE